MVHIFSTPETSQTVVGFGKFTLAKIPTSPSLPFSGTPKSLKEGSLAPDSRTMGESNGPSHRLFSILSLGHMMGWKIFYRQQESKGLNLFSDQSLHHLEETELSVPQSSLPLPGQPQIMTTNNTCERLDVHLHCEIWSNYTGIFSNSKEHIPEICVTLPLQAIKFLFTKS